MTFSNIAVLIALAVAALIIYIGLRSKRGDITIPPAPARKDLGYCMFGCYGDQVAQTTGWVNRHWEAFWQDTSRNLDACIADIKAANLPTVIDVQQWLFTGPAGSRTLAGEGVLRSIFDKLNEAGVLSQVRWIVPCDEPNLPGNEDMAAILPQAVARVHLVAAAYPELAGVCLGCTFTTLRPFCHLDLFDTVGFDDYGAKSGIFKSGGAYEQFRKQLRPDQKTWLFPGAYIGQAPEPFVNFANGHSEVDAIVVFIHSPPAQQEPNMKGIKDMPDMLAVWKAAGQNIVNAAKR